MKNRNRFSIWKRGKNRLKRIVALALAVSLVCTPAPDAYAAVDAATATDAATSSDAAAMTEATPAYVKEIGEYMTSPDYITEGEKEDLLDELTAALYKADEETELRSRFDDIVSRRYKSLLSELFAAYTDEEFAEATGVSKAVYLAAYDDSWISVYTYDGFFALTGITKEEWLLRYPGIYVEDVLDKLEAGTFYPEGGSGIQTYAISGAYNDKISGTKAGEVSLNHKDNATCGDKAPTDSSGTWTGYDHVFKFSSTITGNKVVSGYCVDFADAALGCPKENYYGEGTSISYNVYRLDENTNNYRYLLREFYYADPVANTYGFRNYGWSSEAEARTALRFCLEDSLNNSAGGAKREKYDKAEELWSYVQNHEIPDAPSLDYAGQSISGNTVTKTYKFTSHDGSAAGNTIDAGDTDGVKVYYKLPGAAEYTTDKPAYISNGTYIRFEIDATKQQKYTYNKSLETTAKTVAALYYAEPKAEADNGRYQSFMFVSYKPVSVSLNVTSNAKAGEVKVKKTVKKPSDVNANHAYAKAYTPEGCEYTVYDSNGKKAAAEVLKVTKTGESNAVALNPGKYYLQETKANSYTKLNETRYYFEIKASDNGKTIEVAAENIPEYTSVKLKKDFADSSVRPYAYSLAGCRFDMYSGAYTGNINDYKGVSSSNYIGTFVTDESGDTNVLPAYYGTYTVIERVTGSLLLPVEPFEITVTAADIASAKVKTVSVAEPVRYGHAGVNKVSTNPEYMAANGLYSYSGAVYYLYDSAQKAYQGFLNDRTHIDECTTDAAGKGLFTKDLIIGRTYYIREVKASPGYNVNRSVNSIRITADDKATDYVKYFKSSETPKLDPAFVACKKENGDGEALSDVWFKVEYFDKQPIQENAGGSLRTWYIKADEAGEAHFFTDYIVSDQELAAKKTELDRLGVSHGITSVANDDFYYEPGTNDISLPLGWIRMTEVWSPYDPVVGTGKTGRQYNLDDTPLTASITAAGVSYIAKDGSIVNDGAGNIVYNTPTIKNDEAVYPTIVTTAAGNVSKNVAASEAAVITDTVSLTSLVPGRAYIIRGSLMDKMDSSALLIDGKTVNAASGVFTAEGSEMTLPVKYTFDATGLDGHTLVVYERLYEVADDGTETLRAVHEDINDPMQTVYIPKLETDLADLRGIKEVMADDEAVIKDTLTYSNLIKGKSYRVIGKGYI